MRLHYDKKSDALYIRFDESPYAESDEIEDGIIFDYYNKKRLSVLRYSMHPSGLLHRFAQQCAAVRRCVIHMHNFFICLL